ncbi:hypothetical protein [Mycolicibacterium tusciae]|uniref:hypothetical protein n=1 Tax=Mycolicibacterium tusciae TaxID=75922 RepID=UPI00024A47D4|nr:hypothetical protein [Mycolicibacterium tusciae]
MSDEQTGLEALNPKVVIWDLDGTLWHGTIDANEAWIPRRCASLLVELAERGIVNTVCSNNSPEAGLAAMRTLGVEKYTVVPHIGWSDKSELMNDIVDFFQVAPDRMVLVDDDVKIRTRLASEFGIIAVDPGELERADLRTWGTEDAGLERMQHYRVLAHRRQAQARAGRQVSSPDAHVEFLRSCATRVHRIDVRTAADRIAELSMRSNRLNLTKSRLSPSDVHRLSSSEHYDCFAITVSDRFGSYGLCGFIAFNVQSKHLDHFLWSCRILNQGIVEHFVARLDEDHGYRVQHPALIDFGVEIDWVTEQAIPPASRPIDASRPSVLLIGGCDLDIVAALMDETQFSIAVRGLVEVEGVQQYGHSGVSALAAQILLSPADLAVSSTELPWIGDVSAVNDWGAHDFVVLSLWVDYCCMTVRCRGDANAVRVPCYKRIDDSLTDDEWGHWVGPNLTRDEVVKQLEFCPPLKASELVDRLRLLAAAMPNHTQLVLLNAAELDRPTKYEWGERQYWRNQELNRAVAVFAAESANVTLVDVAAIVTSTAHLAAVDDPTGFHYRRDAYAQIAQHLSAEIRRVDR